MPYIILAALLFLFQYGQAQSERPLIDPLSIPHLVDAGTIEKLESDPYLYAKEWKLDSTGCHNAKLYRNDEGKEIWSGTISSKIKKLGDKQYAMYRLENQGGSANIGSLRIIEIKEDSVQLIKLLVYGDRCDGGLYPDQLMFQESEIRYRYNITPEGLGDLISGGKENDLCFSDCLSCCFAEAHYIYDITKDKNTLTHITIDQNNLDTSRCKLDRGLSIFMTTGGPHITEDCFDEIINLSE